MYQEEGYRFMGAAFEVYNELGYGMAEEVYQQSMEIELELQGIPFLPKKELVLQYKGRLIEKRYVPDLFVYNGFISELKSVTELTPAHEAQLFNYMRIARVSVSYLVNFGHKETLQWRRFVLSDLK